MLNAYATAVDPLQSFAIGKFLIWNTALLPVLMRLFSVIMNKLWRVNMYYWRVFTWYSGSGYTWMYSCYGMRYQDPNYSRLSINQKVANLTNARNSCPFLARIQPPSTLWHWIHASAGMTLRWVVAGSMKIFTHSIWERALLTIISPDVL